MACCLGLQENLLPFDGELYKIPQIYQHAEALALFLQLHDNLAWREEQLFLFGKWVKSPRLVCWYGDANASYRYSGIDHQPLAWPELLWGIKMRMEQQCAYQFNSVLGNLYRDGQDAMGWHSDKEPELGAQPLIASLSFGETRLFKLCHKKSKHSVNIELADADLLIMAGSLQQHWRHALPKSKRLKRPRINLTFRKILV
ncbi:MAG: alpha-ketoglutarate-dependent dioxygenase AlkB [Methylococcaceae bacterium]|jgi:alkylated DNA repair dioxygenase AlkB